MKVNIPAMIELINKGLTTKKQEAKELGIKDTELTKLFKECGYHWSHLEKVYLKVEDEIEEEILIEEESKKEVKMDISKDVTIEDTKEVENNKADDIDDILNSISNKKKKTVPLTTHLREDISEALNKFGKDNGRGSKQELINKLLEMALAKSGHLQ